MQLNDNLLKMLLTNNFISICICGNKFPLDKLNSIFNEINNDNFVDICIKYNYYNQCCKISLFNILKIN